MTNIRIRRINTNELSEQLAKAVFFFFLLDMIVRVCFWLNVYSCIFIINLLICTENWKQGFTSNLIQNEPTKLEHLEIDMIIRDGLHKHCST